MKAALALLAVAVIAIILLLVVGVLDERRQFNKNCAELSSVYSWWVKNGRPPAGESAELVKGFREDLIVTQTTVDIDGVDYFTIFSIPIMNSSGSTGQLFVSTNGVLILQSPNHGARTVSLK